MSTYENDWDSLPDKYKEPEIRLISKETDLSKLIIDKYSWDLVYDDTPYQIVRIPGYIHHVGGKRGIYDLWAYPLHEEMSYDNLMQFSGAAPVWGIKITELNRGRFKWGDQEIENRCQAVITRNDEDFYDIMGNSFDYLLTKARSTLLELQEFEINFHERGWDTALIGRKVWYNSQPAIVDRVIKDQGCVMLKPDGSNVFNLRPDQVGNDFYKDGEPQVEAKCEYLYPHINWFRD